MIFECFHGGPYSCWGIFVSHSVGILRLDISFTIICSLKLNEKLNISDVRISLYAESVLNVNGLYVSSDSYSTAMFLFFSSCASSRPLMSLGANCVVMLRGHPGFTQPNTVSQHTPRIRGLSEFARGNISDSHPKRPYYCWPALGLRFFPWAAKYLASIYVRERYRNARSLWGEHRPPTLRSSAMWRHVVWYIGTSYTASYTRK